MLFSKFVFAFTLINLIAYAFAAISYGPIRKFTICKNENCESFCEVKKYKIKPGESIKTNECTEIFCLLNFSTMELSCGQEIVDGCLMQPDFTKKYPECCGQICTNKRN
ncbi:hypothetical protein PVAND_011926 [Polypedilum vanderplanki]|uniref:Single domain-containing protein n=1 Tax=Polypedilum vanderplanki TaxID=319348 RepID=A0A9J6CKV3_POLVA|nr:hypothetical protein PVAND_011926 [Polypedilum vanderplanki]